MSLTHDVDRDTARALLAQALFAERTLAAIVAEGIEQKEELAALRNLGVSYGRCRRSSAGGRGQSLMWSLKSVAETARRRAMPSMLCRWPGSEVDVEPEIGDRDFPAQDDVVDALPVAGVRS